MRQSPSQRRLGCEHLEDRTTPAWGTPWFDGTALTLSFVPDGTDITGNRSDLAAQLENQPGWQWAVLRAYQTWAVEANLNVGLVADGGQPMGVAGAPQGDIRFGDIRVGGRPLPSDPGNAMAGAAGFDYGTKTWAGDLVFNTSFPFTVGATSVQQNDLFSIALHEAGHSFGLPDTTTDTSSVMYAAYSGVLAGLSAGDVQALQALYGPRQDDAFEGAAGNGTLDTAYDLTANGNQTAVSADVTRIGDADVYKFTTPSGESGVTGLTVNLKAAGISLLTARVTVLDAAGNVVASTVATDPMNNDLSIAVPNYQPSTTYYVKVEGAATDVFSIGAYVLRLDYSPLNSSGTVTAAYYQNTESGTHDDQATAQVLAPVEAVKANAFVVTGELDSPTEADWYAITPSSPVDFTGTLFVGTTTTTNGLQPAVGAYDASGQLLPTKVIQNDSGSYEIQLAGAATGATYYIRVAAADPSGSHATGTYTLGATLAPTAPVDFNALKTKTATAAATTYSAMTITGDQLTQIALTATGGSSTAATAVRVTIFDSSGHTVFTTVAVAGRQLATGLVWLPAGTYAVAFTTATQDGSAVGSLSYTLSARPLSDPIDPYLTDPTTTDLVVTGDYDTAPLDVLILDAIADPFADPSYLQSFGP
jgi:hypothetical protein